MKIISLKIKLIACFFIFLLFTGHKSVAQLNPMAAIYFQNQYLSNPAMVARNQGINLSLGFQKQASGLPGSPAIQTLTGEFFMSDHIGLGLNINNEKSGLFNVTRTTFTYAYRVPMNDEGDRLSFGASFGMIKEHLDNQDVVGDEDDGSVAKYNNRGTYVDGDFGIAYLGKKLAVQLSIPNLKNLTRDNVNAPTVNGATFFSAVSYSFDFSNSGLGFSLQPKVVYRGIKGFPSVIDAGSSLEFTQSKLNVFCMYHSVGSATFGMGFDHKSFNFSWMYSSSAKEKQYAHGNYEVSVRMSFGNTDKAEN